MSAWPSVHSRQGRGKDCSTSSSNPMVEGPWCRFRREARAREQHRHAAVDSLKVLDPKWPIREATKFRSLGKCRDVPQRDSRIAAFLVDHVASATCQEVAT